MTDSGPNTPGEVLLVVAAPAEAKAVTAGLKSAVPGPWDRYSVAPGLAMVVTGIGKANAAGATGRFAHPNDRLLSIGVGGALSECYPGDVVIASTSVFADEGVQTPTGFLDCDALGFPLASFAGSAVPVSEQWTEQVATALGSLSPRRGPIATVSTCSGTDALAQQVRTRTGALAEGMEGAAIALIAHRLNLPFAEVRIISNTTGDRDRQTWDLPRALARLSDVIGLLAHALRNP